MANRAFLVLRSVLKVSGRGVYYPAAFSMRRLTAFYNRAAACVGAVLPMVCLIKLPAFGRRVAGSRDYDSCFVGYLYAAIRILEPHIAAVAGIVGLIAVLGTGSLVCRNKRQVMRMRHGPIVFADIAYVIVAVFMLSSVLFAVTAFAFMPMLVFVLTPSVRQVVAQRITIGRAAAFTPAGLCLLYTSPSPRDS